MTSGRTTDRRATGRSRWSRCAATWKQATTSPSSSPATPERSGPQPCRIDSPVTRVEVDEFVGVGELTGVTISQASEIITIIEIPDEIDEPTSQVEAETETTVADVPPPTALPDDVDRGVDPPRPDPGNPPPEVLGGGSGRDSGQLAVSVIVSLVVLVLVFRTPLPAASTQRWRS